MANHISNETKTEILNLYKEKYLIKDIAFKTSVHYTTISRYLQSLNLQTRKRKYVFNEHYFSEIDTSDKAYWLGFIFADGSNDIQNGLRIALKESDKSHLSKFLNCLNFEKHPTLKIRKIKDKEYVSLKITSKILTDSLIQLGIGKNKTKSPILPNVPEKFKYDFLRGLFDGDGCFYFQNKDSKIRNVTCYFTLHESICEPVLELIKDSIPVQEWSLLPHWRTSYIRTVRINGINKCSKFLDKLYKNSNIFLDRKRLKVKQFYSESGID
jgi:intein/homing endonuclease